MRIGLYCVLAVLWPALTCFCQVRPAVIRPLEIGDQVPQHLELTNVLNFPSNKIRLSDLKGKLVILDLWSTWCSSCIAAFPKAYELQNEFRDQVQVILVDTYEGDSLSKVRPVFERLRKRTGLNIDLPLSLQQAGLKAYFPHATVPHYVWISPQGKVLATTYLHEMNRDNILSALRDNRLNVRIKSDKPSFDSQLPLFVNGNGGNENFIYRTYFTKYIEGIGTTAGSQSDSLGRFTRFFMYNTTPRMMLKSAFPKLMNLPRSRVLVRLADPLRLDNIWNCYETIIPPLSLEQLQQHLQYELPHLLRLTVRSEERRMKCLVICKGKRVEKHYSKGGKAQVDVDEYTVNKFLRNLSVSKLVFLLNNHPAFSNMPVIDQSGLTQNIDAFFPVEFRKMDKYAFMSFLRELGFELSEDERQMTVTIISDK